MDDKYAQGMKHIMVDLETLGRAPGCSVISIGAVAFTAAGLGEEFYVSIDPASCEAFGLSTCPETLAWWSAQSEDARRVFTEDKVSLPEALQAFRAFYLRHDGARLWGNGVDFDNAILQACYDRTGEEAPWKFWNNRCFRTLRGLRPHIPFSRIGVYHNALDDAKTQAVHAIAIFKALNYGR